MKQRKGKKQSKQDTKYAHNSNYCMILPAADEEQEHIVSGGQS